LATQSPLMSYWLLLKAWVTVLKALFWTFPLAGWGYCDELNNAWATGLIILIGIWLLTNGTRDPGTNVAAVQGAFVGVGQGLYNCSGISLKSPFRCFAVNTVKNW